MQMNQWEILRRFRCKIHDEDGDIPFFPIETENSPFESTEGKLKKR